MSICVVKCDDAAKVNELLYKRKNIIWKLYATVKSAILWRLQYSLVNPKRTLTNYKKILKKCSLVNGNSWVIDTLIYEQYHDSHPSIESN